MTPKAALRYGSLKINLSFSDARYVKRRIDALGCSADTIVAKILLPAGRRVTCLGFVIV